ncbi:hypothetical protein [Actinoplanes sp. NPDC048796]|uniref:hypothetical protein n=1 Tax=unclassified Actinoplanes TaxID=2626549 RepID=UPI0033CA10D4
MSDTQSARRPRRDASGRLATIGDLLGTAMAGLVTGAVVLLLLEAVLSLTHVSEFGNTSGWLAVILPVWLFVEEFRAEGFGAPRVVVALLATGFGVAAGMTLAGFASSQFGFPTLVTGLLGALGAIVVYCLIWFYGLRWLDHRTG